MLPVQFSAPSEQPRHGHSLVPDSCPSTSSCVAGTTMVMIHPSCGTASRAARSAPRLVHHQLATQDIISGQKLGVLVRIDEQRRDGSVQQQVAAVSLGPEARQFHELGCHFQQRESGQTHFGLPDRRCPFTSFAIGRTKQPVSQLTFDPVSRTTFPVSNPVTDDLQRSPSAVFTANQVTW